MLNDLRLHSDTRARQEATLIDGLLHNGTDRSGHWRAHAQEMTMARQAAERRYARSELATALDGPARLGLARERAAAFEMELARINLEHRIWMREYGMDVVERYKRRRTSPSTTQQ